MGLNKQVYSEHGCTCFLLQMCVRTFRVYSMSGIARSKGICVYSELLGDSKAIVVVLFTLLSAVYEISHSYTKQC